MQTMSASWRTSNYSGHGGQDCVEVARDNVILVRDTKDRNSVTLSVTPDAWARFTASLK